VLHSRWIEKGAAIVGMPELEANCAIPRYLGFYRYSAKCHLEVVSQRQIDSLLCTVHSTSSK
jgi:hypothetical protein